MKEVFQPKKTVATEQKANGSTGDKKVTIDEETLREIDLKFGNLSEASRSQLVSTKVLKI